MGEAGSRGYHFLSHEGVADLGQVSGLGKGGEGSGA